MTLFEKFYLKKRTFSVLFYGLIGLLIWPILKLSYLVTHDGPAHIYNACLIRELISGNSLLSEFILLKKFPEPNWIGHFFLSACSSFMPANIAEKLFIGIYLIFFPHIFRKIIQKVNPENTAIAFMVIHFVYSYFLFGGLYNFIAGVTVLFLSLNIILPKYESKSKIKYLWIFIFSILLYFSHLVAFGVFLIIISLAHLFSFLNGKNGELKKYFPDFLRATIALTIALLPSLILLVIFLSEKLFIRGNDSSVTFSEMINALIYISPIITLQYSPENIYSIVLFSIFIYLVGVGITKQVKISTEKNNAGLSFYQRPIFWGISSAIMLLLFFFVSDQAASGGVLKFRFELFFFLFLVIFLSTLQFSRLIKTSIVGVISCWMILKFIYLFPKMKNLNDDAVSVMQCTSNIKENSLLLPLNYSPNWMHCNLLNYAGTVKNIFVLDNYEAGMPHFPLEWKENKNPVVLMGNFNISPPPLCADMNNFEITTGLKIDYVLIWNYTPLTDSCSLDIQTAIASRYHLVYHEGEKVMLYKRN